jgi:aryl-alcohol dehydrogenase
MRITAAVSAEPGSAFVLRELELGPPRPDEVLLRVVSVGICRSDLHTRDAEYPVPHHPVVAGHECTGVVESVGEAVTSVAVGDRVLASYPSCGNCPACLRGANPYCRDGFALSFGGSRLDGSTALSGLDGSPVSGHVFQQSSFATHAVVHENNLVRVPDEIVDLAMLAPLGCGVQTGCGTVMNSLRVGAGASLAVWGTGSVGLSAVMAAAASDVSTIIAIDTQPARLALARELGATHTLDARDIKTTEAILDILPDGVDAGVETTGVPRVLADALAAIAMRGELALVGAAPTGATTPIDMGVLLNGRRLRGVIQGDAVPQDFIPRLLKLHLAGRLPFDRLVTTYRFTDIDVAINDMSDGTTIKPVLLFDGA